VIGWQPRPGRRHAKNGARRFFGAITVVAVALTVLVGGRRYFYCRSMDQVMTQTTCDCARAPADKDGRAAALTPLNDCFEVRFLGRLVSFTLGAELAVPAAGLVAVLPVHQVELRPSNLLCTGLDHPIRAGPVSPTATRAQLMVFLT
jgi:hypothetical protein